jgi:hypothetical protein
MAGHQPDLFHPGVWIKNFALNGLAKTHRATPLNLIVDSDSAKSAALRVPAIVEDPNSATSPRVATRGRYGAGFGNVVPELITLLNIPFNRWTREVPYEELKVTDHDLFAQFPIQVAAILKEWQLNPILPAFWAEVQQSHNEVLSERFAAARRSFERRWGCHNLEIPVSWVCRTEAFAWFACHLLADLQRFHTVYNGCLLEYRRGHGIRSRSHPVPELAAEGDWLETPFWAWRSDNPHRRRLLARPGGRNLELRLDEELIGSLPLSAEATVHQSAAKCQKAVAAWRDLERRGIKVRGRALLTTLYARLFLADLFIHGIGGAKYDELTDEIIRRFFGVEPPEYLVLSATVLLPLPSFPATPDHCRRLARQLRDLHWNPHRHLTDSQDAEAMAGSLTANQLAAQKSEWILRHPSGAQARRERFLALRALTNQLNKLLANREERARQELRQCHRQIQANAILQRRDYAFCLYPEALLRPFLSQFSAE